MLEKDREQQALLLFESLDTVPLDTRDDWLIEQCAGDRQVLERVRNLLSADQSEDASLRTGHFLTDQPRLPNLEWVGPYRINSVLGEGGMGIVYLADRADGTFQRHVAIKFMRSVGVGSAAVDRFHSERAILASMQHPNIAQLIDGGALDARLSGHGVCRGTPLRI